MKKNIGLLLLIISSNIYSQGNNDSCKSLKKGVFEIYENGQLLNQNASSIDYQKYLEHNIMKLNYRSFIQVVILGSSSYEPFMKMKSRYRKEAVEEILDIKVFSHMDWILRDQQSVLNKFYWILSFYNYFLSLLSL